MTQEQFPGWLPAQIAKHYGFPLSEYTGKGQSIAIISLGGKINMDELATDFKAMRISMPNISVKSQPGISQRQDGMATGETHLDVEVIGALCPDADITIYRGVNPTGFASAIQHAVDDRCNVISISWGGPEQAKAPDMEAALQNAREQGITVTVASGDSGSSDERDSNGVPIPAPGNVAQVDYPASNPNVLACGGTELVLQNGQHTEWVWNNTNTSRKGGAGGGGVSRLFGVPDYQANAGIKIPSVNDGSTGRVVPDVAGLAAAGDWNIFESDQGELIGGTSAVAPLWASLIALINEGRAQQGKAALGFVNDKLYALAAQGGLFNDVVNGNNSIAENYPGYEATAGFDACSGWGTPIGAKIVKALLAAD